MTAVKGGKVVDKNYTFWRTTEGYFITCIKGATVCIICNENISIVRVSIRQNMYHNWSGEHTGPVNKGQNNSASEPSCSVAKFVQKFSLIIRYCSVCSLHGFWNLTQKYETFSDAEIIKDCLEAIANVALPDKTASFWKVIQQDLLLEEESRNSRTTL